MPFLKLICKCKRFQTNKYLSNNGMRYTIPRPQSLFSLVSLLLLREYIRIQI
jgi:hypothetical protein